MYFLYYNSFYQSIDTTDKEQSAFNKVIALKLGFKYYCNEGNHYISLKYFYRYFSHIPEK